MVPLFGILTPHLKGPETIGKLISFAKACSFAQPIFYHINVIESML